jgi:putative colanic acid biosynthesis glycosyltransferase
MEPSGAGAMRVLQINTVCGTGSTGRIATDIHNCLVNNGHESYIAYGRGYPRKCNNAIKIGSQWDVYSHVALTRLLDKHGLGSAKATKSLIHHIDSLNPDIIHLHNIHGYYINYEILFEYIKERNRPVVWTLHDCWAFTGHCAHFDFIGCEKWKVQCNICPQTYRYPKSLLRDNSGDNYLRKRRSFTGVNELVLISPSKWLARLVTESFLGEYHIEVIHNGIDVTCFKPIESHFRVKRNLNNKFIILGVANRWEGRKGLRYFVELCEQLEEDEVIVLVGLDKKQLKNLPKKIIGMTRTDSLEELVGIYSAADVFVNPTLEDNFPTTNLEALACGTPVITFDTGGSSESIGQNCGYVVSKGDLEGLVTAIRRVKRHEKLYYRDSCVNHVRENFNKEQIFKKYLKIYENVL